MRNSTSATLFARDSTSDTLAEAFANESRRGALLAIVVYAVWSGVLAVNFLINLFAAYGTPAFFRVPTAITLQAILSVLLPIPIYIVAARSKTPLLWCFVSLLLDILIFAQGKFFWFSMPAIFAHAPLFIEVRYSDILSFLVLLAIYALPLSRAFIAWGGVAALLVWTAGIAHAFLSYNGATLYWGPFGTDMGEDALRAMMNPLALIPDFFVIQILLGAVFVGFLTRAIRRARSYVVDRVAAEADAAFLERFFPPDVAAKIVDGELLAPARRHVAILFAHVRSRDGMDGEDLAQMQVRLGKFEKIAFSHGGILDRFTGGPIMVTFGALDNDADAAAKALACAREAVRSVEHGSQQLFVALHSGETVCGDVGGTRSRVFSVVGDAVNVTTRILDVAQCGSRAIVGSGDFTRSVFGSADIQADFLGDVTLRGRGSPVQLWSFDA